MRHALWTTISKVSNRYQAVFFSLLFPQKKIGLGLRLIFNMQSGYYIMPSLELYYLHIPCA